MGQKVHPNIMRLGIVSSWRSVWYAPRREFSEVLHGDLQVRRLVERQLSGASVSHVLIERPAKSVRVTVHTARPGVAIGKRGGDVERLRRSVAELTGVPTQVNIVEVRKPELSARLVAENVALQLGRRAAFRRVVRRAAQSAMRLGAGGIKIGVSGRLGGAEIARTEWHREGRVPLHTLRADIDYSSSEVHTPYGVVGVKVWIFRGEVLTGGRKTAGRSGGDVKGGRRDRG